VVTFVDVNAVLKVEKEMPGLPKDDLSVQGHGQGLGAEAKDFKVSSSILDAKDMSRELHH